jgi:hypothetical protein
MSLYNKIINIYPELANEQDAFMDGTICLQNDSDGKGDYIAKWEHPVYPEPTQEQLDAAPDVLPEPTPVPITEKLATLGIDVNELKTLLGVA